MKHAGLLFLAFSLIIGHAVAIVSTEDHSNGANVDRVRWTTSNIKGTPDPPLPFSTEQVFDSVELTRPTHMTRVPGTDRWIVVQQNGKVWSFNRSGDPDVQLAVDLKQVEGWHFAAFGIAFHPEFPKKPWCYITYKDTPKSDTGARLSRFRVIDPKVPKIKLSSEMVLMKWRSHDHMGGQPLFGPDGFLYMSIGDGQRPTPPDPMNTGQDISDLQASILRIDVDNPSKELNYSIPDDNPFVNDPNARGEIWAFGVRNPWRLCFRENGELWVGDVGWEMREMVYRIERGANYGWSVKEGSQDVKPMTGAHSIPISKAIIEHDHVEARSITGGFFWNNPRIPELVGAYIYGDWMTGKVWALKYDSEKEQIIEHKEIVDTPLQIISFAIDDDGDVLIVGYDGTIHRLIPNPRLASGDNQNATFPRKLSETGLFASVLDETPSPGVVPFEINAHHWADNTTSKRWIGLVDDATLSLYEKSNWMTGDIEGQFNFPHNTVVAKTVYLQLDPADPNSNRRIETQVLHRFHDDWMAYNYVWNDEQTDAVLQENIAVEREFQIAAPESSDGYRKQKWLHSSRDQCMLCHIWSSGTVHGFKRDQLNLNFGDEKQNQLAKFSSLGLFESEVKPLPPSISPNDTSANLEKRARAWLDLNCAHCHRQNGGGTGSFVLEDTATLDDMKLVDMPANQGDFGLTDTKLIVSGDPSQSVLLYRLMKSGHGRMPQFGTSIADDHGVILLYDWIKSLGQPTKKLHQLEQACKAVLKYPDSATIGKLLESTPSAIVLAATLARESNVSAKESIARVAARHERAEIRDLFERFLPASEQIERLGNNIDIKKILAAQGDVKRGRSLWFNSSLSCRNCHQIAGRGQMVGPTMDDVGSKRTRKEILTSLIDPSANIEEAFQGHVIATEDGELISGLKLSENDDTLVIVDSEGKQHRISRDEIEESRMMKKSIMPEQLLSEMTLQQAADLLKFLENQK